VNCPSRRDVGLRAWTGLASLALLVSGTGTAVAQEITKLPVLVEEAQPEYPPTALEDRVEAEVQLEFTITSTGAVTDVRVVGTSTRAEDPSQVQRNYPFGSAAAAALRQFRFEPAEADGVPVPVTLGYTFRFGLPEPEPAVAETATVAAPRPDPVVNFEGVIRERGTRRRLAGVVVTVFRMAEEEGGEPVGFEAVTDQRGEFRFFDLEPGSWRVLAEKDGYFPGRTTEVIRTDEVLEVTLFIEAGRYNPYDVTTTAQRTFKEVNRRSLRPEVATRIAGAFGDPISAIQNLPGVARVPAGVGQLPVRGSAPADTGILFEGIETPFIFHFGGLRSVVPGELIESVEFIPGNFSAYYGRRTGGIIDVQLKDLDPDQVHGKVSLGILEGQLYLEAPIVDGLSVAGGVRRSWIDLVIEAAVPDDGSIAIISAPVYTDYQFLVNWRPGRAHDVRTFFFGSRDRLALINRDAQEANIQLTSGAVESAVGFNRVIVQYDYTPSQRFSNEFQLGFGLDEIAIQAFDFLEFNLDNLQWQLRNRARWRLSDAFTLDVGFDGLVRLSDVSLVAPNPNQDPVNPDLTDLVTTDLEDDFDFQGAPFVEANIDVTSRFTLVPGIRFDYFADADQWVIDPRLLARYRLTDQWTVKAGAGSFSQPPQPQDLNETIGNPDLDAIRSFQGSAGFEYRPFDFLTADVTVFYKRLFGVIGGSDGFRSTDDGDVVPEILDNNTAGEVVGLELFVNHAFNANLQGFVGYTLSRATRTPEGEPTQRFDFDQTHIFVLAASYLFPQNWELAVRWRLISGSPFTDITGGVLLEDNDEYGPIFGTTNGERLPFFHQLDIRIDKRWVYQSFTVGAFLEILNSYNRSNVEGFSYNFDFSERDQVNSLPIIPNLGVEVRF
jgi:TonB family protein